MDRWSGVLRVSLEPSCRSHFNVAASLCMSSSSRTIMTPSLNAVFFNGDRVRGTGDPVIEKLSDIRTIASILVSKLSGYYSSVNVWVVEASTFNGPFAVYKEFISSVNSKGEPKYYNPVGFPAATSTALLLTRCLQEATNLISAGKREPYLARSHFPVSSSCARYPKTIILGFSKGGAVLNQLLTELAHSKQEPETARNLTCNGGFPALVTNETCGESAICPTSIDGFLNSISEFHYVDVGLNCAGAYLTDRYVIKRIGEIAAGIRFVLHGTPRQWCDGSRPWIHEEKDELFRLLEDEEERSRGKLKVCERFYFAERPPSLRMHFKIIENIDLS